MAGRQTDEREGVEAGCSSVCRIQDSRGSAAFEKLKINLYAWGREWRVASGRGLCQEVPNYMKEYGLYPEDHRESLKGLSKRVI